MKLTETYDLRKVNEIAEVIPKERCDYNRVREILSAGVGTVEREYVRSTKRSDKLLQRVYCAKGYQQMSNLIFHYLVNEIYRDIDIKNCHPVLWEQICVKHGIATPSIADYCQNREKVIGEICEAHPWLNRADVKQAFIVALNCGDYKKQTGAEIEVLTKFSRDVSDSVEQMKTKMPVTWQLVLDKEKKPNKNGSFVSFVVQQAERKCIDVLIAVCKEKSIRVGVYRYDGVAVEFDGELLSVLRECEARIKSETGHKVELIEKPMPAKPLNEIFPKVHISPTDRLVIFELKTLANRFGSAWRNVPTSNKFNLKLTSMQIFRRVD